MNAASGDVKPVDRRANSASSRAPSAALSGAPSEAPAPDVADTAPPAESPAQSTGVVAAVTHAAEAAFTAVSAAAEKVVSLANGPVEEPPLQTEASEAVPKAADDAGFAGEAPGATHGLTTRQQTEAGSTVIELQHMEAAEDSDGVLAADEVPGDAVEERKAPWSQPATPPTDQAEKDKCAA